jgi:peptide deformylase
MSLEVIQYPHPTLRHVSRPVKKLDAELRHWVGEMFGLMYKNKGVGLAANQVDLPYRLFVANLTGDPKTGEEHVFVNPVITKPKGMAEEEEGCLSLPGLYALVRRPARVTISAFDLQGKPIKMDLDGLFARVVQHEVDHLDGRLFIDRLNSTGETKAGPILEEFEIQFAQRRQEKGIPSDDAIKQRIAELEAART